MTDHDSREHDLELAELWNVLSTATNRDLARRRKRIRRRAVVMSLAAVFVLATSVALAMPNGPIRNLFAPDVPASKQILGMNQLGRPLGGDEDASIRRAYSYLSDNVVIPVTDIPQAKDARVLIDQGGAFKMIGVTTKGANGGLCVAVSYEEHPRPGNRKLTTSRIFRDCQQQISFGQPFTSTTTKSRYDTSKIVFGMVADGVHDITFVTTMRTVKIRVENKAYYWKSKPNERIINMTARRPDGTLYQWSRASALKK